MIRILINPEEVLVRLLVEVLLAQAQARAFRASVLGCRVLVDVVLGLPHQGRPPLVVLVEVELPFRLNRV